MSSKSTGTGRGRKAAPQKPEKPYADFPLFAHATRRWAKKIRGKFHYFGPWDDPEGALQKYLDQKDDLHAGRTPRAPDDGLTLRSLVNRFLTAKRHLVDTREMVERTWQDYHAVCGRIIGVLGPDRLVTDLAADDFATLRAEFAKTSGPVTLGNLIQRARVLFKFAYDEGLIDRPIRYGQNFRRPSRKTLRKVRNENGPRMFEADEIRRILDDVGPPLEAMVLLGINCGFGNSDVGNLPQAAVNLETRWVDYPRPKTGIQRRCPLWPETVAAISEAIAARPTPSDVADDRLLFITRHGQPWAKPTCDCPVAKEFTKVLPRLGLHRRGRGFYALRHTFETIGGEARDQVAVDHIMGHAREDMASVYRERVSDERLLAVSDHVREWLFPKVASEEAEE